MRLPHYIATHPPTEICLHVFIVPLPEGAHGLKGNCDWPSPTMFGGNDDQRQSTVHTSQGSGTHYHCMKWDRN